MLNRRANLGKKAKRRLFDLTATAYRYPEKTGADKGEINWQATPTTLTTLKAHKQLASTQAVLNANLEVKQGQWLCWTEPYVFSISTDRLLINSVYYDVKNIVWSDASHTQLIIEEVNAS